MTPPGSELQQADTQTALAVRGAPKTYRESASLSDRRTSKHKREAFGLPFF